MKWCMCALGGDPQECDWYGARRQIRRAEGGFNQSPTGGLRRNFQSVQALVGPYLHKRTAAPTPYHSPLSG